MAQSNPVLAVLDGEQFRTVAAGARGTSFSTFDMDTTYFIRYKRENGRALPIVESAVKVADLVDAIRLIQGA